MLIDSKLYFSSNVALTSSGNSNVIDVGNLENLGIGESISVVVNLKSVSGTSPTLGVTVQSSNTSNFSSVTTVATVASSAAVAGRQIVITLPKSINNDRYFRLNYTVGGTSPSITVDAYFIKSDMIQNNITYPTYTTVV